ncbi:MAG TPA: TetR/AcrR family transcriptional regulator [Methylocella sp.]|nr:TetR/AcrR family transcriptional regulator [Methylocella sp.]
MARYSTQRGKFGKGPSAPLTRKRPGLSKDQGRAGEVRDVQEPRSEETYAQLIGVAERLFQLIGFQKTTVADIAREMRMSPANVYRFFATKSQINEAVCKSLLGRIEAEAEKIAASRDSAAERLRHLFEYVGKAHIRQYRLSRKLHDLIDAAVTENWAIMSQHSERMRAILETIIAGGMDQGEFARADPRLAASIINTICIRFCHPRLIVEYENDIEPSLDQMITFCLEGLAKPQKRS